MDLAESMIGYGRSGLLSVNNRTEAKPELTMRNSEMGSFLCNDLAAEIPLCAEAVHPKEETP